MQPTADHHDNTHYRCKHLDKPQLVASLQHSPLLIGASSIVVEQLPKPHDASVRDDDSRTLAVGTFLGNLQVSASDVPLQVKIEQLGLDLQTNLQVASQVSRR